MFLGPPWAISHIIDPRKQIKSELFGLKKKGRRLVFEEKQKETREKLERDKQRLKEGVVSGRGNGLLWQSFCKRSIRTRGLSSRVTLLESPRVRIDR